MKKLYYCDIAEISPVYFGNYFGDNLLTAADVFDILMIGVLSIRLICVSGDFDLKKGLMAVLLIAAIAVFLLAGYKLYTIYSEYKTGTDEYMKVSEHVRAAAPLSNEEAEALEELPEAELTTAQKLAKAKIPVLSIDFEDLKKINPDFIGWIYYPGLGISYPIVQGEDDEFYLHHTFEGAANSNGCIFAGAGFNKDFTSFNTFLYGHNMRNGSMFGSLKRLVREEGLFSQNKEFFVYTEEAYRKYRIYSYYITPPTSDTYQVAQNRAGYDEYVLRVHARSVEDCGTVVDTDRPSVTLSTCSGTGAAKQRLVVHGILEEIIAVGE